MRKAFRFVEILERKDSIEVDICLNVQQRTWLKKSSHTLKIQFHPMTVAEDLRLNPNEFEQWLKVFPELIDGDAVAINKVQTWMIWGVRTPWHWRQHVMGGMPEDMWPLSDPPPLVLRERLGIDLTTAVDWRLAGFEENIDETFYDLWLELRMEPRRAWTLYNEHLKWRSNTPEPDGELRVTMPLLKLVGIHLSFENFVKYRNLELYGVVKLQAKGIRRANRWYRLAISHRKSQILDHIPRFVYRFIQP